MMACQLDEKALSIKYNYNNAIPTLDLLIPLKTI